MNEDTCFPKRLTLGVHVLDRQHKIILNKIENLLRCISDKTLAISSAREIEHIFSLIAEHFSDEEALMLKYNYPYAKEHSQKHSMELDKIVNFRKTITNKSSDSESLKEFLNTFAVWFKNQILLDDVELARFLKRNIAFRLNSFLSIFFHDHQ